MPNVTECLVDYLFNKATTITDEIKAKAEACREDYLAVTAAGAVKNRSHWERLLACTPDGTAELIGYEKRSIANSGTDQRFNITLELDDGQRFAAIPWSSIISTIKAAADDGGVTDEVSSASSWVMKRLAG